MRIAIAHSHGGNIVAAVAAREPELFDDIITLNTPFFARLPRHQRTARIHTLLVGFSTFVLWAHVAATTFPVFIGVMAALAVGLVGLYWWLSVAPQEETDDVWTESFFGSVGPRHQQKAPSMWCLTAPDDEAFAWLDAVDAALNLPYMLMHKIALVLTFVGLVGAHWFWQWDFARAALQAEVPDILQMQGTGPHLSFFERLTWAPAPPLNAPALHDLSQFLLWTNGDRAQLALVLLRSVFEYFLVYWSLLALIALAGSVLLGWIAFGAPFLGLLCRAR